MISRDHFIPVGEHGIGNPRSQIGQSMSFFNGHLYLGVTHPKGEGPFDAARILRYQAETGTWEAVYESSLVEPDENAIVKDVYRGESGMYLGRLEEGTELVPLNRGYRCMTQFQKKDDESKVLFVSTISHWGSQLLYSMDGEHFDVASQPDLGDGEELSFRTILGMNNKLFAAPVGTVKEGVMDRMFGDIARLYVSDDPVSGSWEDAIIPGFGDPTNRSVFSMTEFDGHIYAGTGNPDRGFQLWKTRAEGQRPYEWKRVLTDGAYRYNNNEFIATLIPFNGALYVGSGIPGLGYDKAYDVGPAAAELIRVYPDDSWDLITGTPRFTPDGLKVPLSLMGPGFDDPENSTLWSMAVYDDTLYIGTHHCESFHTALSGSDTIRGGFHLWASIDGENWEAVTLDGFGDPFATGVRTMIGSPEGLFLGTSTHREIEKIWQRRTRTEAPIGEGGLTVWLGK